MTIESYEMKATTHQLEFNGAILRRGFWLYVWEVTPPNQEPIYYVGRTGDSSSRFAQSPFNRIGQHLGMRKENNALRRSLENKGIDPSKCTFRWVAHGPILAEADDLAGHRQRRDVVAAYEKALADSMCAAGYAVMNKVNCHAILDNERFSEILTAFAAEFPKLHL